jgi:integrating conjugative element protein (TIGR03752 family)
VKGNLLLKLLVPLIVIVAMVLTIRGCSSGPEPYTAQDVENEDPTLILTDDDIEVLGIEGDTPADTLATLVGEMRMMRRENDDLRQQLADIQAREISVDARIEEAVREHSSDRVDAGVLETVRREIDQVRQMVRAPGPASNNNRGDQDLPIGLGLGDDIPLGVQSPPAELSWVEPIDAREVPRGGTARDEIKFPRAFGEAVTGAARSTGEALSRSGTSVERGLTGQPDTSTLEPRYTVPENSMLVGSLAMNPLIGRIPVDGTVNDPYQFRVLIGRENLMANGIELPELHSAIARGTATGDWTLSCVRGQIHSLTFIFDDGTVRTVPSPGDVDGGGGRGGNSTVLGEIADAHGVPCVSGERTSNAAQYLGTQSLLTAAGAGVATLLSDGNSVSTVNPDGTVSSAMTGSQAAQSILAGGVSDMSRWVNRLYGEAFAAIVTPPGQEVIVNIDRELHIDYDTAGRRVRYDQRDLFINPMP